MKDWRIIYFFFCMNESSIGEWMQIPETNSNTSTLVTEEYMTLEV